MNFEKIRWVQEGSKLTLTIANPPVNSLSKQVIEELMLALDFAAARPDIVEVVLTGEGEKFFSAGANLKEMYAAISEDAFKGGYEFSRMGQAFVSRLLVYPKLTTALINGYCFGGGFEVALACRRRVAYSRAWFGLPEVTLGIIPGWGGTQVMTLKFGQMAANHFVAGNLESASDKNTMYTSRLFVEVLSVNDMLSKPPEKLRSTIARRLAHLLVNHAETYGNILRPANLLTDPAILDDMFFQYEAEVFALLCASGEAKEGLEAFLEKRPSNFRKME